MSIQSSGSLDRSAEGATKGTKPTKETTNDNKSSWQGTVLVAVILLPMVAAYVVFHTGWGAPRGTVNEGTLLNPARSVTEIDIELAEGKPLDVTEGKKKWRLLIPVVQSCEQTCQDNLYLTRQVHVRLGEKARRVERILLWLGTGTLDSKLLGPELLDPELKTEHPRLLEAITNGASFANWLSPTGHDLALGEYLLVDQEGFAMMVYSPEHDGNQLLKDIKKLLKYSYEN